MKVSAYFIFPDKDDDIIALGDNPNVYQELIKDMFSVKQQLNKNRDMNFELCYDSDNVDCFLEKIGHLLTGIYLSNCRNQINYFFNTISKNVKKDSMHDPKCIYINWNIDYYNLTVSNKIIKEASESTHDENNNPILIDFANTIKTDRDSIHIIKDAIHESNLPMLISTPIFDNAIDFAEWYKYISAQGFNLGDKQKFEKTQYIYKRSKRRIYKCRKTGYFWYRDYFHKDNKEHYEVFDCNGYHLGEADMKGNLNTNAADKEKSIRDIIK